MFRYKDVQCLVCSEELTEQDDIVVCPECGAPHHRACWMKLGACAYKDKHGTEETWQPPHRSLRTARCPYCGALNAGSEERCNACGESMLDEQPLPQTQNSNTRPSLSYPLSAGAGFEAAGIPGTESFGEATAEEIGAFVGPNAAYYLKKFQLIHKLKKLGSFNFAALFFPGLWMLYRKMYRMGALVTGVIYALEFLYFYVTIQWSMPLIEGIYARADVKVGAYDIASILRLGEEAIKMSGGEWLLTIAPFLILLFIFGISLFLCIMGNKLYYRHVIGRIRDIRAAQPDGALRTSALSHRGGINIPILLSVGACYYLISNLFKAYLLSGK